MNDQELAAEARRVAPRLSPGASAITLKLAAELLRQQADRLDGPAPLIGYLIDGRLWHPSDVTIVRQGAEARAGCPDHRPVLDSVAGWYCAACGSDAPPA